jgi:hypothetical protein
METKKLHGSCHCGAVRFEFEADLQQGASRCNCSVCTKIGMLSSIVKPSAFKLVSGEKSLSEYQFGAKSATRYFCKTCGIHCFGRGHLPEVGGDYVSINYNCLDDVELVGLKTTHWDGRHNNWHAGSRDTPWPIMSA